MQEKGLDFKHKEVININKTIKAPNNLFFILPPMQFYSHLLMKKLHSLQSNSF